MEEAPEDAGGTAPLFQLCAQAVTANMERLEQDVWGLPAVILQGILPLLNIYYLERIEQTAVQKGLSTQSIWCKLWNDVMKSKPSRFGAVTCWRKKFLEAFFHNVLRGILDVSSDRRLHDRRFSPLVHSARHVSELTICNKQQGVSALPPAVLQCLAQSVETLKFLHLRSSEPSTQAALRKLLHHLIHHGRVNKVSVLSWPCPDNQLLVLILTLSAGFWERPSEGPCVLCSPAEEPGSALLSLQPLNISQSSRSSGEGPERQGGCTSDPGDLYDFIFSVPPVGVETAGGAVPDEPSPLHSAIRFRSVRALNLHNVPLTLSTCRSLCHLLRSWVSLERLTMAYNDLGANITLVLEALLALSRAPDCALTVFSMSDFTTYISTLDLAHTLLCTFPGLQLLSLSYDLERHSDKERTPVSAEFPENRLEQLELRFPQDPLQGDGLVSVLKASPSLTELSLDNATFPSQDGLTHVLRAIAEYNRALRRLSFHDMKMAETHTEILRLLQHSSVEELKFSFCRLFERDSGEFLTRFVDVLKRNSSVRILKLCGNRLGNDGLCALADLYAADSVSAIHYLDVSSNCIKADGLLRFAKKLEGCGELRLRQMSISQNLLDRDPILSHEALQSLEGVCCVVSDNWNSAQAFADHVSVM